MRPCKANWTISSANHAILYAHLHHRYLDIDRIRPLSSFNNDFDALIQLSVQAKSAVQWWVDDVNDMNGRKKVTYQYSRHKSCLFWFNNSRKPTS